jgi:hypothetical protein
VNEKRSKCLSVLRKVKKMVISKSVHKRSLFMQKGLLHAKSPKIRLLITSVFQGETELESLKTER